MFLELMATIFAGLAAAGVVMLLRSVLGGRLPRWAVPVAAGGAMIAATISSEYSWYERTAAALPEGVVVAQEVEKSGWLRPWTRVAPYVDRFVAVDDASVRRHPEQPDQRIVDLLFFGRWSAVQKVPVLFDCAGARRADLIEGAVFGEGGAISGVRWIDVPEGDPVLRRACEAA